MDQANAGDDPCAGRLIVIHSVRRKRSDLQEGAAVIEQLVDPLTRQQLAPAHVAFTRLLRPTQRCLGQTLLKLSCQRPLGDVVGFKRPRW